MEEVALGEGVRVRGLVWQAEGRWLVSDEAGSLIQVGIVRVRWNLQPVGLQGSDAVCSLTQKGLL